MVDQGDLLWTPGESRQRRARIARFMGWLAERGHRFTSYEELHRWSVEDLDGFWSAVAQWLGVRWSSPPTAALGSRQMPGAQWFPDGRLNYADHLLYPLEPVADDDVAVVVAREDAVPTTLTWTQLREQVAAVSGWLRTAGVGRGDRVAGLLPNGAEALIAVLATTSLGAVWSSCSPDFGATAIRDRFQQIDPVVLFTVDGYRYGGRDYDVRTTVDALRGELPTVRETVHVRYADGAPALPDAVEWTAVVTHPGELRFEPMAFDDPLWVLYSSGTTGLPKPIVHGHGTMLLEHAKQLALHLDLGRGDRFFWFTTTGWMMWNLLISGLAVGATVVLYDGNPGHPDLGALWRLAAGSGVTFFGVSAPYLQSCLRSGLRPADDVDLSAVRGIGSTGAPLSPEGFAWVYDAVKPDVMLSSLSGGTDVCSAFVGGVPLLPVHAGEIPCRLLGCAVEAYDTDGKPVVGEVGELVITAPMPSMPVRFWNDLDGSRLREAYFSTYPGVWRHGDWIEFTARGSCVIYGRSDSTLNRGGVRMGTSEFYRVVEEVPAVEDALVIDTSAAGTTGRLLLFVVLASGAELADVTVALRERIRSQLSPRHVPDEVIAIAEVPRTLNGKKCEVPVKRVLSGVPLERAVAPGALANPRAMQPFVAMASDNADVRTQRRQGDARF